MLFLCHSHKDESYSSQQGICCCSCLPRKDAPVALLQMMLLLNWLRTILNGFTSWDIMLTTGIILDGKMHLAARPFQSDKENMESIFPLAVFIHRK